MSKLYLKEIKSCRECPSCIDGGLYKYYDCDIGDFRLGRNIDRMPGDCPLEDVNYTQDAEHE